jgi:hypothetical protein
MGRIELVGLLVCTLAVMGCSEGASVDPNLGQVDVASPSSDLATPEPNVDTVDEVKAASESPATNRGIA